MAVSDFIGEIRQDFDKYGVKGLKYNFQDLVHGCLSRTGFWHNYGEDFYGDWDLLILVDSCRWDLMEEVVDDYDWVETHSTHMSNASHSREWMHKTFMEDDTSGLEKLRMWGRILRDPDNMDIFNDHYKMSDRPEVAETAYVTWNVFAQMLDGDHFESFVPLGRAKWGDSTAILPPRRITDETIRVMRENDPEYTIAHYMQPHTPFRKGDTTEHEGSVWERIHRGEKPYDEAWAEYKDNLEWVMDDIELLLENVDADKVVISSDHGNAIGEWGCYGHRPYVPLSDVKRVPWLETTATDEETYEPEFDKESNETVDSQVVQDRLSDLGYV